MRFWNWLRRQWRGRPDVPAPAGVTLLDEIGIFLRQTSARGWVDPDEFVRIWDQAPGLIEFLILRMPQLRDQPTDPRRKRKLWQLARAEQLTATMLGEALGDDRGTTLGDLRRVFRNDG